MKSIQFWQLQAGTKKVDDIRDQNKQEKLWLTFSLKFAMRNLTTFCLLVLYGHVTDYCEQSDGSKGEFKFVNDKVLKESRE